MPLASASARTMPNCSSQPRRGRLGERNRRRLPVERRHLIVWDGSPELDLTVAAEFARVASEPLLLRAGSDDQQPHGWRWAEQSAVQRDDGPHHILMAFLPHQATRREHEMLCSGADSSLRAAKRRVSIPG